MQIGEPMLQLLLYKKAQSEQNKNILQSDASAEPVTTGSAGSTVSTTLTSADYEIANDFAMNNFNESQKIAAATSNILTVNTNAVTISSLSAAEISRIKQVIYDLHHPTSTPEPEPGDTEETPDGKIGFMSDFGSVDEMFDYINTIDPTVTKETGLDSNALWQLTQRDDWEQNNNSFFGIMNHGFNLIDTDGDDVLSYDEIADFIGDEMATAYDYLAKVKQYSNELQIDYRNMTDQQKLDFAIEKAREYFEQVGLTDQIQALNRLIAENKIGFKDLNEGKTYVEGAGGWVLGAYICLTKNDGSYASDDDQWYIYDYDEYGNPLQAYFDQGGLFLDETYYTQNSILWYDLVGTIIHELTHATAYLRGGPETWGEYVAYQTEEDYRDSIACGQWSGNDEQSAIHNHIDGYYNSVEVADLNGDGIVSEEEKEPIPGWKWWTYGDYA